MVRNAAAMQGQHARLANAIAIACPPPLTARLHVLPPARRHSRHSASSPATSPLHLLLLESNPLHTPSPNPPLYISPPPPPIAPLLCPLFFFLLSLTLLILASSSSSIQWICTLPTRGGRRTRRRSGRCRSRRPSRGEPLRRRRQAPRRPRCTASSPGSSGTSCRGSRRPAPPPPRQPVAPAQPVPVRPAVDEAQLYAPWCGFPMPMAASLDAAHGALI